MNRSYRIVWSKARGAWMVVSETAKSNGKDGGTLERAVRRADGAGAADGGLRARLGILWERGGAVAKDLALTLALAFATPTLLWAGPAPGQLPTGGQVASGQAQITVNGHQMTVQQGSDKAILNWQSFNIGSSAAVRFEQPGSSSVALNRVQSSNPSHIFGQLSANGQIMLLNPNGVLFSPGSRVDVGALVAGAMKISDADFLAGRYTFTDGQGSVVNQGELNARDAGLIALLAPEVRNEGVIRARQGTVVLAAGEAITLNNSASGWGVVVDKGAYKALVENKQLVSAEDGTVFISARAVGTLQQAIINNSGSIEAKGALRVGGKIRLSADVVNNSGSIDASAPPAATGQDKSKGGDIQIAASEFVNTGTIRANGDAGGSIAIAAAQSLRNEGTIEAKGGSGAGGQVALTSGGQLAQTAGASVSVRGEDAGVGQGGDLHLRAAQLNIAGTLDASGDGQGGSTRMVASQSTLDGAQLNVSGDSAGGQIDLRGPQEGDSLTSVLSSSVAAALAMLAGTDTPAPEAPPSPLPPSHAILSNSSLNASSRRGRGGQVTLTSDDISLDNGARVDATGALGGGTILVGGDWQGGTNPSLRAEGEAIPQATRTHIGGTVTLDASANEQGDGGTIVAWSDIAQTSSLTTVSGQLMAKGGVQGGNGGRIETSGRELRVEGIHVDTLAPRGNTGEWLLDPYDITISGDVDAGTTGTYTANADSAVINVSTLQTALGSSNVTVFTGTSGSQDGNITVASALINTTANSLTLKAANNIVINADITSSGTGALILRAGSGSVSGTGTLILGSASNTTGANLHLAHGTTLSTAITLNGAATIGFASLEVEYLVVGGGGNGEGNHSGYAQGGGGGDVKSGTVLLSTLSNTVTVGAGGTTGTGAAGKGGDSSAFGVSALGGQGSTGTTTGRGGTSGSGFLGGLGLYDGGGGGGAGGAGTAGTTNSGTRRAGLGGVGIYSSITGSQLGYGGGGSGAYPNNWVTGSGGQSYGGGGPQLNGSANTGGGAGGGGDGGSGVVIVRYRGAQAAGGGTAAPGTGTASGYTVHKFTTTGASTFAVTNLAASITGAISGAGALTSNAAGGTLTLSGANTHSNGTTVAAGTLKTTHTSALSTGTVKLNNTAGATLNVAANLTIGNLTGGGSTGGDVLINAGAKLSTGSLNAAASFAGDMTGAGELEKVGTGVFTLTGANTYSGTTTITEGELRLGNAGTSGSLGTGSVVNNASLTVDRSNSLTFNNVISGTGLLNKRGAGALTLGGGNSYSGGTVLDAGTIVVRADTAMGTGALTMANSTTLQLAHGTALANAINLTGAATIEFASLEVEYLVVGGGGGGGYPRGGGGGAGGFLDGKTLLSAQNYNVTVGAGGAALKKGANSSITGTGLTAITAEGGGSGSGGDNMNGGSGGGASAYANATAGTGIAGQGFEGGLGTEPPNAVGTVDLGAGGGGGAGGPGQPGIAATSMGGAGGIGKTSDITGSTVWYAGGGGGFSAQTGGDAAVNGGAGGQGGGGKGGDLDSAGQNGTANTGGGGGGTYTAAQRAGTGGSGIVVIRYRGPVAATGGNPASGTDTATGYAVHRFTDTGASNFTVDKLAASLTGTISGTGALTTRATGGTLTLSGANTYSNGTAVAAGTLKTTSVNALGTGSVSLSNTAGTQLNVASKSNLTVGNLTGGGTTGGHVLIDAEAKLSAGALNTAASYAGNITGQGVFEKVGSGTFTLTGTPALGGTTQVSAGTLEIGGSGALGEADGFGRYLHRGEISIADEGTLRFASSATQILAGSVSSLANGVLLKSGSGSLRLAAVNTDFAGTVTATGGTLGLYTNTALGTGKLQIGGATLSLGRAVSEISNAITLTGAVTVNFDTEVDYLIVAGGGGGGGDNGGGGGAGGFIQSSASVAAGTYAIAVGAGGAGGAVNLRGSNGNNSSFNSQVALGGGGGGGGGQTAGTFLPATGGSGGGGDGENTNTAGAASSNAAQGYGGGAGKSGGGGGGGGAGGAGTAALGGTQPGNGGIGRQSSITGTLSYYAGGGGGAPDNDLAIQAGFGLGGLGGGGNGGIGSAATSGQANTGGGGGGAAATMPAGSTGGAGGSGVVVVRYLGAPAASSAGTSAATGLAQTGTNSATGYTVHRFTNTGSHSLTLNAPSALLSGAVSGSGALTANATGGTLTLSGNNSYSGTTTISGGTVKVGAGSTSGSLGAGAISNNAALVFDRTNATGWTVANAISGSGTLTKQGSGTLVLTGGNSYTGTTAISAGTLQIGDGGTTGSLGMGAVTNNASLVFNRSNAYELSNVISGSGSVDVKGGSTLTLTGNASYAGATSIDASTTLVLKNNAPTTGSSGFSGAGTLAIEPAGTSFASAFSTSGWNFGGTLGGLRLGKSGNTAGITLTNAISIAGGLTVYGGSTTVNQAFASTGSDNLFFEVGSLSFGASGSLASAGSLQIQPQVLSSTIGLGDGAAGTFSLGSSVFSSKLLDGFSGITIGHAHNTGKITVGAIAPSDKLTLHNTVGGIELTGALNATANTVVLDTTGTITDTSSGAITAGSLAIKDASSAVLDAAGHSVGTLAASNTGALTLVNTGNLTVGTVNPTGITATGAVRLVTTGNLLVDQSISTSDRSANAVVLIAGSGQPVGTTTGGDIQIASGATITMGDDATGKLYTGSLSGSTNVAARVGSGTGNFRYYSKEGTHNFSKAIGTGLHAIYREQPTVTATVNNGTIIYGDVASPTGSTTGLQNGDSATYAVSSPAYSTAGYLKAGSYTLVSNVDTQLGYALSASGSTGTLTVSKHTLALTGTTATDKVYDGTTVATLSAIGTLSGQLSGVVGGVNKTDAVNIKSGYTAAFDNRDVGNSKTVTVAGLQLEGVDADNYTLAAATATASASITPRALTVTAAAKSKNYGDDDPAFTYTITTGALATGDTTFNGALSRVAGENAGTRAITQGTLAVNDGNSGKNYTLTYVGADLSITGRAITLTATDAANTKVYGSADPSLVVSLSDGTTLATGDSLADVTGTLSRRSGENVGTYDVLLGTGSKTGNYVITYTSTNGAFSITPRPLSLTGSTTGVTKTYDGAVRMPNGVTGYSVGAATATTGLVANDAVEITGVPVFASPNAGTHAITQGSLALSGASASNYTLNWTNGSGTIDKAPLTVRANNDARFVAGENDATNYAGVSYSGFVNGETASSVFGAGAASVTRSATGPDVNPTGVNTLAGTYTGALTPLITPAAGYTTSANNYDISYLPGNYTIVPAENLLVKVAPVSGVYGDAATYTVEAAYLQTGTNTKVTFVAGSASGPTYTVTGNAVSMNDGAGGAATFSLVPLSAAYSTANKLKVGSYQIGDTGLSITGNNFKALTVVGLQEVTPKSLTWAPTSAANKVYDGTTGVASLPLTLTGVVAGTNSDVVSAAAGSVHFASRHVGTTSYTVSNVGLTGADAGNYVLASTSAAYTNGSITPRLLSVNAEAKTKVYGDADPTLTYTTSGLASGDTLSVTLTRATGENVASNYAISSTAYTISDGHATPGSNYTLSFTGNNLAITPRPITVKAQDQHRVYGDANPSSGAVLLTGGSLAFSDALGAATLTAAASATATANAGTTHALAPSNQLFSTGVSSNYDITYVNGTLSIDKRAITVTADNQSRQYGLATNPSTGNVNVTAGSLVNGDAITSAAVSASTATQWVTAGSSHVLMPSSAVFGSGLASNYDITYHGGALTITQAPVTLAGSTGLTKTYDGGTGLHQAGVTGYGSLSGVFEHDNHAVWVTGAPVFSSKDAGARTLLQGTVALGGGAASNYALTWTNGSGTINKATLGITGTTVADKVYDGTTTATPTAGTLSGLVGSETLTFSSLTALFGSKDAGTQTATVSYTLGHATDGSGGLASNYTLAATTHSAQITPKALTMSGLSTADKVYNGNTTASVTGTAQLQSAITAGAGTDSDGKPISGDSVSLAGTAQGQFNSKDVLTANRVSFSGLTLTGPQAGNYTLTPHADNTSARITAKPLGLDVPGASKVYDGTTDITPSGSAALTGVVAGDTVELNTGSVTGFVDKNVGVNKPVTFSGFTLGGADAGNYSLISGSAASTATITPRTVSLSASKDYDGLSTLAAGTVTITTGVTVNGTTEALTYTHASASDPNVATEGKYISAIILGDATIGSVGLASNYQLPDMTQASAENAVTISPVALTITASDDGKTYNGQTYSGGNGVSYSGFVNSETSSVLGGALTYSGSSQGAKDAGSYVITPAGLTSSNYTLSFQNGTLTVNRANAVVTGNSSTVTYNGLLQSVSGFTASGLATGETESVLTSVSASGASETNAGSYANTVTGTAIDGNYNLTFVNGALTIDKATLTVTADDKNRLYGQANPVFTQTITGFVNSEDAVSAGMTGTAQATSTATSTTAVGSYTITSDVGTLAAANYSFVAAHGTLTIDKANLTLSGARVYDGSTTFPGQYLTATGANGETFSVTGDGDASNLASKHVADNPAGTVLSSVTGLSLGSSTNGGLAGNYNDLSTTGSSVSLSKASASVSGTATSVTYNGQTQTQLAATSSGFIAGDAISISGEASGKNAGTYTSALKVTDNDAANYDVTITNADLVIGKANLTLAGTRVYDGGTSFSGQYLTATGVNGESFTVSGGGDTSNLASKHVAANQGVALSTVTGLSLGGSTNGGLSDNYNALSTTGSSVSLSKASAAVSGTTTSVTYNGQAQSQQAATSSGFIADDAISISGEASDKNAGTYRSTLQVTGNDAANYEISISNADFVINKAAATVTANSVAVTYNGQTQSVTGFKATGLVAGETEAVLTGVRTSGGSGKNAGRYAHTVSGTDGNYNLSFVDGALTIDKAALNVTFAGVDKVYDGNARASITTTDNRILGDDITIEPVASFADKNVGTGKPVSITGVNLTGLQADNYRLITTTGSTSASITRLNSVTWAGDATGDWFDPANWAVTGDPAQRGVVPDLANVAYVIIPNGHTVNYSTAAVAPAVASSPVQIDGLSGGGGLAQGGGQLIVGTGGVALGSLNQSMGSLTVAGNLSVNRSYGQFGSGTVQVSGTTTISAVSGPVQLGNLTSAGALTVASKDGAITQADNTVLVAGSNSSFTASTGSIPAQAADIILTSAGNDFAGLVTANGRDVKINSQNTLNLDAMAAADLWVQAGNALTIQGRALNLHSASVGNTTFGPLWVAQHLSAQSTSGSLLQTAPLRVDGKSELNAAVSIDLTHIDNQLVNGVQALAPRVSIIGDRVAQTSAAAAAAAAAATAASAAQVVQSAPSATGSATSVDLALTVEPVSRVRVQAQGSGMVIASGSTVRASSSVVKAGVELVLNPAPAPTAAPVATGSVAVTDAAFVQVKSFEPLPVSPGSSFSFTLPGDAFVHKDPQMAVSVSAQTPTGDKLPEWLSFSPAERRFTGVAPQGVTQIEVVVKAVDASGVEATTVIALQFNALAQ